MLLPLLVLLAAGNLFYGAVPIPPGEVLDILLGGGGDNPAWSIILTGSRLPQAATALLAGAALAVSGLLLQTLFHNPLAGPSILGISDGANLGVALIMLAFGGTVGSFGGYMATVAGAMAGACAILGVIVFFSRRVGSNVMLLIIGIMVGYLVSSCISILNYYASADKVRQFVMWGMGDFSSVSSAQLPFFSAAACAGLVWALLLVKPLNALLLGEKYAANLGVNVRAARIHVLVCTGDDSRGDGLLRPHILHRPGRAPYCPVAAGDLGSPRAGTGDSPFRRLHCPGLQYADGDTRDGDAAAAECGDSAVRGAGDHIRHSQP